jgi:aminomuconate-semialdehyde/2-hydroxymuconate-6-semialdehyde dehydrogenase
MDELTHLIDGEPVATDQWFHTVNPATRQPWARVARGSTQDAARAVSAARVAFDEGPWPRMSPDERGAHLHRLADLIEQHTDELVATETIDMGKPVTQCRERDLPRSVANFRFFADYPRFCEDESLPSSTHHIYTSYEPVGVTAAISPWNFPLMLSTWKVAPALAFGNTVVLKPAEQSPGTCTRLGELAIEAGLPRGVLNVLHGYGPGEAGEALTTSPDVDLVTFTGESNTGRKILQAGAPTLKRVSFELGGKSANLVFADADLDAALDWSIKAAFTNTRPSLSGRQPSLWRARDLRRVRRPLRRLGRAPGGRRPDRPRHRHRAASKRRTLAEGVPLPRHRRSRRSQTPHRRSARRLVGPADGTGQHHPGNADQP